MIKSFSELFESINLSSLTSVPYYFSRELSDFLIEVRSNSKDSEVVNFIDDILKSESDPKIKSGFTFIDLTDKNDMVSMIQTSRVHNLYKKSGETIEFRDWLSYEKLDKRSKVWTTNRTESSIGRTFRKMVIDIGKKYSDKTIENFVNVFKSFFDFKWNSEGRFELVEGEIIRKWYNLENYETRRGQLGNSCMRYENCSSFFDIYVHNPEVCKLLVLYSNMERSKISGRALIWTLDNGKIYMDRAYTNEDSDIKLFEKYAEKFGWLIRWSSNLSVKLEVFDFDEYPYMDTFSVLDVKKGILYSDSDRWPGENLYFLQQTDGSYKDSKDLVWSDYYGEYVNGEDCVELDGDYILRRDAIYLKYKDEYVHPNSDYVNSRYEGDNILPEDYVWSDYLYDYIFIENSIEIPTRNIGFNLKLDNIPNMDALVDVICQDVKETLELKTIQDVVLSNPQTGVNYLKDGLVKAFYLTGDDSKFLTKKDSEILNVDISDQSITLPSKEYIENLISSPKIKREELTNWIMKSDFNILDHRKFIDETNILHHQQYIGSNPKLSKIQIESFISRGIDGLFSELVKLCLDNLGISEYQKTLSMRSFSSSYLEDIAYRIRQEMDPESKIYQEIQNSLIIYQAFIVADLLKDRIIKDKKYLEAWYYYVYYGNYGEE